MSIFPVTLSAFTRIPTYVIAGLFVCLASVFFILFQGGIDIGFSNHVGFIPVVRRILDPNYLPGDFGISVRLFHHQVFAYLIAWSTKIFGETVALVVFGILSRILLAFSLLVLARSIGITLAGYLVICVLLSLEFAHIGLGLETNKFLRKGVMPPMFAHAFTLLAISSVIKERFKLTAFLTGVVMLFHLQIGVIIALTLFPFYVVKVRSFSVKDITLFFALYTLPAFPALLNLVNLMHGGLMGSEWSLDYIYFAQPNHFELRSIGAALSIGIYLLLQLCVYLWIRTSDKSIATGVGTVFSVSLILTLFSGLHFLDYNLVQQGTITKIQFIRMSPLITVLGAMCILLACEVFFRVSGNKNLLIYFYGSVFFMISSWCAYSIINSELNYSNWVNKYENKESTWVTMCKWIKYNTEKDALFITPPGKKGFTYLTDRSTLVEFKINPDGAINLDEWYARLKDLGGGVLPTNRGFENAKLLNQAYMKLTDAEMLALADKYLATYAVTMKKNATNLDVVYQNADYLVIKFPEYVSK